MSEEKPRKPLKQRKKTPEPECWLQPTPERYVLGQNPWTEIFVGATLKAIGKVIGLTSASDLEKLKVLLARAVDGFRETLDFVGGVLPAKRKEKWKADAISLAKRLQQTLKKDESHYSTYITREPQGIKLHLAKGLRTEVGSTLRQLKRLLDHLEKMHSMNSVEGGEQNAIQEEKETRSESSDLYAGYLSPHLQDLVDRLTKVFVEFCGIEDVCRTSSGGIIYGKYPDFVRTAAKPVLHAYLGNAYSKFKSDLMKPDLQQSDAQLNKQIQTAIEKAKERLGS